jgi:hypothetical protein
MPVEFSKNTQKFGVRKAMEPIRPDEAVVKFENERAVRTFFNNAIENGINSMSIQRIANGIAPTFSSRSLKSSPQLSNQDRLEYLYSAIAKNSARVVLKNQAFRPETKASSPPELNDEKDSFDRFDILKFAGKQMDQFKTACSKIFHADYNILEKVHSYDENSPGPVPVVIDTSSVKEHSTGWTAWDNPFDLATLGAFKAVVAYRAASFLKLNDSIKFAAGVGAQSELISAQYLVTGKSVIIKKWYGSYAIRFNLGQGCLEVPWVKFQKCSQGERMIVELKRKDRLVFNKKPIYDHSEMIIPPFLFMDKYLSDYNNGFTFPEHDVHTPIRLS